ncbi:DUF1499 domain-containing protein [Polymorphobacter sp.]|uniref:DUF1499 domain-containing protein n=1 Tax=Polymorphobacter sp. TaxID=1909290 RepID=UPI003F73001D
MTARRWPAIVAVATLVCALIVLLAGPLMSSGIVSWQLGLASFALAALACGAGVLALVVAMFKRLGSPLVRAAAIAGLFGAGIPASIVLSAGGAPGIHDISTDLAEPPAFVAITPALRGPDSNPVSYDPANIPEQQAAYPLVRPITLALPPAQAFVRAEKAARDLGWTIVSADPAGLRIEATDTVPWWGFKDDVVIRLRPDAVGTRIDVRSKSRVGQGDLGVNADRISRYLQRVSRG